MAQEPPAADGEPHGDSAAPSPPAGEQTSDGAPTGSRTWLWWLNQPLAAGILVVVVTAGTQQCYWKAQQAYLATQWQAQQRFLAEQALARERAGRASETEAQMTSAMGRTLAAAAMIVGAHEMAVPKEQLLPIIDRYNNLEREWDMNEDDLARRVRADLVVPPIIKGWAEIVAARGRLHEDVIRLSATFPALRLQTNSCRLQIVEMEKRLETLTQQTTAEVERLRQAALPR